MTDIINMAQELSAGKAAGIISIAFLVGISAGLLIWYAFLKRKK